MESVSCILCGDASPRFRFTKNSAAGEPFRLVRCRRCGLEFLSPRPGPGEIGRYYESNYFTRRTDRGYDNYFSEKVRGEVTRVLALNLEDLEFFGYEKALPGGRRCLDIGCAAGYSVEYMKRRGWQSEGIDISRHCTDFARRAGLDVRTGDYLATEFEEKFHAITLWATIEHLHRPDKVLEKAGADLHDDGRLYISTCRTGGINYMRLFGSRWRYYNFPEHLYFFSRRTLAELLEQKGFSVERYCTYGSGLGKPGSPLRRTADFSAKRFHWGDMMILAAVKR